MICCSLKQLNSLKFLKLNQNKFTLDGYKELCRYIKINKSLKLLDLGDLSDKKETIKICQALKSNDTLKILLCQVPPTCFSFLVDMIRVNSSIIELNQYSNIYKRYLNLNKLLHPIYLQNKFTMLLIRKSGNNVLALLPRRVLLYLFTFFVKDVLD